jgi:Carotenoid biosynthesis protein
MPVWFHEWLVAPVALALALRHAAQALGLRRAGLEIVVLVAYGFALEWTAMAVFAAYRYSDAWTVAPLGVPLAIAVMWASIILSAMALAVRMGARSPLERAATAAALAIALDLLMEPTAMRLRFWEWTPAGGWLGVPIGNFVGWIIIVGGYTLGAERTAAGESLRRAFVRRVLLSAASIVGLVAVGASWRAVHAESLFVGAPGWCAWALLALTPVVLSRRRAASPEPERPTLAVQLGRQPGAAPLLIFALVAAIFVLDVARAGGSDLMVVAAGTTVGLAVALGRVAT